MIDRESRLITLQLQAKGTMNPRPTAPNQPTDADASNVPTGSTPTTLAAFSRYSREDLAAKLARIIPPGRWTNYGTLSLAVSRVLGGRPDKSGRWVGRTLWGIPGIPWQRIRHADGWYESSAREITAAQKRESEARSDLTYEHEGGVLERHTDGKKRARSQDHVDVDELLALLGLQVNDVRKTADVDDDRLAAARRRRLERLNR